MAISVTTRNVGDVVIVSCNGRIVEGADAQTLYARVREMLSIYHLFVIDLTEVTFIDSAGLGLLVRLLARVRAAAGDLKLCGAASNVERALTVSRLKSVLGAYPTETEAIAAFYQHDPSADVPLRGAVDLVCIHSSVDVLAFLRELLRHAGYAVMTTDNVADGLTLLRATEPKVLVMESALRDKMTGGMPDVFKQFTDKTYVVDLPQNFATDDASAAGPRLLEDLRQRTPLGS